MSITNEVLSKINDIKFVSENNRNTFINLVSYLSNHEFDENQEKIFTKILEDMLLKFSSFDTEILYNPFEFVESIIDSDFLGHKIDEEEFLEITKQFDQFESFLTGKIDKKRFLEESYNIQINIIKQNVMAMQAGIYGQGLIGDAAEINVINKLEKLLGFYPINFIRNIKLTNIFVVNYFYRIDEFGAKMRLGGFETSGDNNLYLSFFDLVKSFDHELFHQAMEYYDDFTSWQQLRLNVDLFYKYEDLDVQSAGFARNYGKENIGEDQATVAEELILNYFDLQERIKTDRILCEKVELVKKAYLHLSDGIMNEDFWQKEYEIQQ